MNTIFESTIKKFNIPEPAKDIYLKSIVKNWYKPIIKNNILKNPVKPININYDQSTISIEFQNNQLLSEFVINFNKNIHKSINEYIVELGEDPKKYNRILVIESKIDNNNLFFYF